MKDNISTLYGALKNKGYTDIGKDETEFRDWLGKEGNVKTLYGALSQQGFDDIGDEQQFTEWIGAAPQQTMAQQLRNESNESYTHVYNDNGKLVGGTAYQEPEPYQYKPEVQQHILQNKPEMFKPKTVDMYGAHAKDKDEMDLLQEGRLYEMKDARQRYLQRPVTEFGEAFEQGVDALYQGGKNLVGETSILATGSQRDYQRAKAQLDELVASGYDLNNFDAQQALKAYKDRDFQRKTAEWQKEIASRKDEREGMGWFEKMLHRLQDPSRPKSQYEETGMFADELQLSRSYQAIQDALQKTNGNLEEAYKILGQEASKETWGDETTREAREELAKQRPTEGLSAWVGGMIPQMIGTGAGIAMSFTPWGKMASILGQANMLALTGATSGMSMAEARRYAEEKGVPSNEGDVWRAGMIDAAIEYGTERLPFTRYFGRIQNATQKALGKSVADAVSNNEAVQNEVSDLLQRASKELGAGLFSKQGIKEYLKDVGTEGVSEFMAEALQTISPIVYQNPEDYPTLMEIIEAGWEGAKGGIFMGAFLGAGSKFSQDYNNRRRRQKQGSVTFADTDKGIVEVMGMDGDVYTVMNAEGERYQISKEQIKEEQTVSYDEFDAAAKEKVMIDIEDTIESDNAEIDAATDPATGLYGEVTMIDHDENGEQIDVTVNVYGEKVVNGKLYLLVEKDGEKVYIRPMQYYQETYQKRPAEEVKAINEEMVREQAAAQAEQESKYAPEVLNAQMQQGVAFDTPTSQIIPLYPMPEGNGWVVEEHPLDTSNKVAKQPIVREMSNDEYRDLLQAQYEAQEAEQAQAEEVAANAQAVVDKMPHKTDETGRIFVPTSVQGDEVAYDITDALGNILEQGTSKVSQFAKMQDYVAPTEEQLNDDGTLVESVVPESQVAPTEQQEVAVSEIPTSESVSEQPTLEQVVASLPKNKDGEIDYESMTPQQQFQYTSLSESPEVALEDLQADIAANDEELVKMQEELGKARGGKRAELRDKVKKLSFANEELKSFYESVAPKQEVEVEAAQAESAEPMVYAAKEAKTESEPVVVETEKPKKAKKPRLTGRKKKKQPEFTEEELQPMNALEFAAHHLGLGNVAITTDSFKRETGYGEEERKKFMGILRTAEKGGMTVEQAAEKLVSLDNEANGRFFGGDTQVARDTIIELLGYEKWGDVTGLIKNNRTAERKRREEAEYAEYEAHLMESLHVTPEEYELQKEYDMQNNPFPDISEEEYFAKFAEKAEEYNNYLNSINNDEGRTDEALGRNDNILSEERVGDIGGNQRSESGMESEGTGSESLYNSETSQESASGSEVNAEGNGEGTLQEDEESYAGEVGYSLSDKTDNEGNRFYEREGNIDLWDLSPLFNKAGRQAAPIRFTERNMRHIIDEHKKELGDTERDVFSFLEGVFSNARILRRARGGAMFAIVENDKTDKAAIIKLFPSEHGDYYNVESAGYYRKNKWKENEEIIAELSEPAQSETASDVSKPQIPDNGGKESLNAETATISDNKDSNLPENNKGNKENVALKQQEGETTLQFAERAAKENERRMPLRKRIREWAASGVKVNVIENLNDVTNAAAANAIRNGSIVPGWYEEHSNEVFIYLPHVENLQELDFTIIHEALAHKGLRGMLGKERFNELCDKAWDMMSESKRAEYLEYVGNGFENERSRQRAAADEYMAFLAEGVGLTPEEKTIWEKIVELFRRFFNASLDGILNKSKLTDADIAELVRMSYANLKSGAEGNVSGKGTRFNAKKVSDRRQEMNRVNNTVDQALSLVYGKDIKEIRKERQEREQKRKEDAAEIYQSVLSGDFNDVTLQKINDYIDDATPLHPYGKRISQRLPQKLERELHEGSRTNAVDALFSRIHESSVPASRRTSEAGRREIEERKKESLKGWAIATNNWHTDLSDFTDEQIPIGEGTDSKVYTSKDEKYVIKVSFGKPEGKRFRPDIDNIPLFNHVFRNSAYEIVGYGEFDGKFARILKQPFVDFAEEAKVSEDERVDYMRTLGFEPINDANTAFSNGTIIAADIQKSNIVKTSRGNIRVIDADVKLHTKDVGGNYTYPPVEADLPEGKTMFRITKEERGIIDKSKSDGTYMKAPNGEPTNLNEKQWAQVRTKAFKNWFGDWERLALYNPQRNVTSVSEAMKYVESLFDKPITNRKFGFTAIITKNKADKLKSEKATKQSVSPRLHAIAVANIDYLFENAEVQTVHGDTKGNPDIINVHRLGSVMYDKESDTFVPVKITAFEYNTNTGNRIYSIEAIDVEEIKKSAGQLEDGSEANPRSPIADFNANIINLIESANGLRLNTSKVVDENGEPMVVYHGTRNDFTVFEISHSGETTNNKGIFGNGFYFTEYNKLAKSYANRNGKVGLIMESFLNVRNPFMWNDSQSVNEAMILGFPKSRINKGKLLPLISERSIMSFTKSLKKSGYDGVVYEYDQRLQDGSKVSELVAFEPNQIKSATDNVGTFDSENNDIRFRFIGERGARNLDQAEEATTRLDNLGVARDMEAAFNAKKERVEKLKDSEPVEITGDEIPFSEDLKLYKKNALEYGKTFRGNYTNKDTGESVFIGKNGLKEVLNHDYKNVEQLQSVAAIPSIIENSIYIESRKNNDSKVDAEKFDYYVCGLKIGGEDYTVRAVFVTPKDGTRYYDHKLTKIEKGNLLDSLIGTTPGFNQTDSLNSENKDTVLVSILQTNDKENAKKIKMATGWERGADGKWRYEVDDNISFDTLGERSTKLKKAYSDAQEKYYRFESRVPSRTPKNATEEEKQRIKDLRKELAKLRKEMRKAGDAYYESPIDNTTLGDFIGENNNLFKEYPELKDVGISFVRSARYINQGFTGFYDPESNSIWIDDWRPKGDIKSSLIHEIQHAIQHIEGFSWGGSAAFFEQAKEEAQNRKYEFNELINKFGFEDWEKNIPIEELMEYGKKYKGEFGLLHLAFIENAIEDKYVQADLRDELESVKAAYNRFYEKAGGERHSYKTPRDWYLSLGGEVEARNVQQRMGMTDEQRRNTLAESTEDVAREDQIFLNGALEEGTRFRISDKGRKIQNEVDKFAEKYNSKETVVVEIASMTDEEIEEMFDSPASEVKDALKEGLEGGYSEEEDKIYIFADNLPLRNVEDTMFHENLHGLLTDNQQIVESFFKEAEARFPKNIQYLRDLGYKESEIPEELFIRLSAKAMEYGIFDDVIHNLPEDGFEEFKELIKEFGYGYRQEIKSRVLGKGRRGTSQLLEGEEIHETRRLSEAIREEQEEETARKRAEKLGNLFGQVADMGLDGVLGNKAYTSAMVDIYKELPLDVRRSLADDALSHYKGSIAPAVSDYLNHNADASIWDKVVGIIRDALRKVGFDVELNTNDVKYILWRSQKKLNRNNLLDVAEDIDKKYKLGVGEYSPTRFRRVYHGSGASFDKFDHSFMGTGEGAQAFGWGTYVTDEEGIGKRYAKQMGSEPMLYYKGMPDREAYRKHPELQYLAFFMDKGSSAEEAIEKRKNILNRIVNDESSYWLRKEEAQRGIEWLDSVNPEDIEFRRNRHLYEVEIPDNDGTNYLVWDKPLSEEQAKRIKDAVLDSKMFKDYATNYGEEISRERLDSWLKAFDTGRVYRLLENFADLRDGRESAKAISMLLNEAGFVGFEYPANYYSGGNEDGSKNYVIFNEKDLEIKEHTRFRVGKKKASETALPEDESSFRGTVISDADRAKVLKNLDNLQEKYENKSSKGSKTFIGDLAKALHLRNNGNNSNYGDWIAVNGSEVTVRISDHNVSIEDMDNAGKTNGLSIVVSRDPNKGIRDYGDAHIVEFYYNDKKLRNAEGNPYTEIINSFKQTVYSGEYKDTTGLAERQEVNPTLFRVKKPQKIDIADNRPDIVKKYDETLKTGMYNFQEAFQDRMLSLKVFMDEIVAATGMSVRSFEDAYTAENQLSSTNKEDQNRYIKKFYTPLIDYVRKLSDKYGEETVRRYIYCKSGLERNEVLRQRDADEAYNQAKEELDEKLANNQIDQAQYNVLLKQADDQRKKTLSEDVDYSGIRGMLFNVRADELFKQYEAGNITKAEYERRIKDLEQNKKTVVKDWKDFAEHSVADLESRATSSELDALWSKINAATNETLRIDFESGMIDHATYEAEKKMMKYYIPLRNWENTTAEDMYEYRHDMTPVVSSNQQKAKGRESEAFNPIASIGKMAENAIVRGNRNKMKLKLYSFVVNRPTALANVLNVWYVKDQQTGTWDARSADISAANTEDEIKQAIEQFENSMEALKKQGLAFKGKVKSGMGFRASKKQKAEHIVTVMINGNEYEVSINGNPRAAQAVNGLTNAEGVNDGYAWIDSLKRLYGGGLTSWNPDFVIPNLVRDTIHASTMTFLDKGVMASLKYMVNIPKIFSQVTKEVSGVGFNNQKLHQYFEEFVANGGETGYTAVHTLEDYKNEYRKLMDEAKGLKSAIKKGAKLPFEKIVSVLEAANRIAEDVNRFNAYVTSRESGENIVNSIDAAKNITVNFNRKGALNANHTFYGKVASFMSRWILFFNPSVQGIYQLVSKSKMNPGRATFLGATIISSGFFIPMLNEMLVAAAGGDDEDDYWNQSDYKRRNNWMLFVGDGYVSIPLPPVLREIYGMGDIVYGLITGHIPPQRAIYDIMNQVQSAVGFVKLLPEVSQEPDVKTWLKGFAPDLAAPFLDVMSNTNFMGRPIAKWTDFNESDPEHERVYKGVSKHWIELSKFINEAGGNETRRSDWWGNMINPAMMEHLVTSYTGGIGKTINNFVGMAIDAATGDKENMDVFRKAPIIPRFYTPNDEKTVVPGINRKFYEFNYQYNNAKKSLKKLQEGVKSGEHSEWQKYIDEMKKNGEMEFIEYFEKENKKLKKIQNLLKGNPSNKKELEQKEIDKKAEIAAESFRILRGER